MDLIQLEIVSQYSASLNETCVIKYTENSAIHKMTSDATKIVL